MAVTILRRSDVAFVHLSVVQHRQRISRFPLDTDSVGVVVIYLIPDIIQSLRCCKRTRLRRAAASGRIEIRIQTAQRKIRIAEMAFVSAVGTRDTQTDSLTEEGCQIDNTRAPVAPCDSMLF